MDATPVSTSSSRASRQPGSRFAFSDTPPQSMKSMRAFGSMTSSFARRFAADVTGGRDVHGMSTTHVTPPAAAARVPVSKFSRCVNPGSSKWT